MASCQCVLRHSPPAPKTQVHHILPLSWGGPNVAENRVTLCGTTHDAIHELLNRAVRSKTHPTYGGGFGNAAVTLARRGLDAYLAAHGGAWPTIYTVEAPQ